jgi:hypothetical protein
MIDSVGLDLDRLPGVRLSSQQGICDTYRADVERGTRSSIRESETLRVKSPICHGMAQGFITGGKRLKRPYLSLWKEPAIGFSRLSDICSDIEDYLRVGNQTSLVVVGVQCVNSKRSFSQFAN